MLPIMPLCSGYPMLLNQQFQNLMVNQECLFSQICHLTGFGEHSSTLSTQWQLGKLQVWEIESFEASFTYTSDASDGMVCVWEKSGRGRGKKREGERENLRWERKMEHQHSAHLPCVYIWLHGSFLGSWVGVPLLLVSLISSVLLVDVISGCSGEWRSVSALGRVWWSMWKDWVEPHQISQQVDQAWLLATGHTRKLCTK